MPALARSGHLGNILSSVKPKLDRISQGPRLIITTTAGNQSRGLISSVVMRSHYCRIIVSINLCRHFWHHNKNLLAVRNYCAINCGPLTHPDKLLLRTIWSILTRATPMDSLSFIRLVKKAIQELSKSYLRGEPMWMPRHLKAINRYTLPP